MVSRSIIRGKTKYQTSWVNDFLWVEADDNDVYRAKCKICKSSFSVDSMGRQALVSHLKGKKHQLNAKNVGKTTPLKSYFAPTSSSEKVLLTSENTPSPLVPVAPEEIVSSINSSSSSTITSTPAFTKQNLSQAQSSINRNYLIKEEVTKAEIRWCLQTVTKHFSLRDAASSVDLFKIMFPDSEVASLMNLQRTKISYSIIYGIAYYFETVLFKKVKECSEFVVGYDESLNKIAQKQQMDVSLRFWDDDQKEVVTRYWTSVFLEHTKAEDLKNALEKCLEAVGWKKVIQVSMDGPNVNFKALRLLQEDKYDACDSPKILDLGSCGLHTVNCALKAGMKATDWGIVQFLHAAYNLFKDVPARRGTFSQLTKSDLFPLKFCPVRWTENVAVADRALAVLPGLKKYTDSVEQGLVKPKPSTKSYATVKNTLKDSLLLAKITFFKSIAEELQPFLKEFQSPHPMAPFLYDQLLNLNNRFARRFVKEEVLKTTKIQKIDLDKQINLMPLKLIDLGYSTRQAIRKCKEQVPISDEAILDFRNDCLQCYRTIIKKLLDRSPLNYKITQALTCINPIIAASSSGPKLLKSLLEILVDTNQIQGQVAGRIEEEYSEFCSLPRIKREMENYVRTQRLDRFWFDLTGDNHKWKNLKTLLKKVFILSHGNADLERGFSINKECLVPNLEEATLKAQRLIYDTVKAYGGVENLEVTKGLVHAVRNSHGRYKEALEDKKKEESERKKKITEKRRLEQQEKELKAKKQKLLEDAERQAAQIDEELRGLKRS